MEKHQYAAPDMSGWQGRIDSTENYAAFRWHQWMKGWDLRQPGAPQPGKLGIALIGFCCDEGIKRNKGREGASLGPLSIRKELTNVPCAFSEEVTLVDAGNILCQDGDLVASQNALAAAVSRIRQAGFFPVVLGGGHETALGHYRGQADALRKTYGKAELGIINFDAHFDLRPLPESGSSGTMFRQIAQEAEALDEAFKYFCLGIQRSSNTLELFNEAKRRGVQYILAGEVAARKDDEVIDRLDAFLQETEHVHLTLCADVVSSAFAPGVSSAQPMGLQPEDILKFLKHILRSNKVVGFDIAEVSPRFDRDNATSRLAMVLIFGIVDALCRLKGLAR